MVPIHVQKCGFTWSSPDKPQFISHTFYKSFIWTCNHSNVIKHANHTEVKLVIQFQRRNKWNAAKELFAVVSTTVSSNNPCLISFKFLAHLPQYTSQLCVFFPLKLLPREDKTATWPWKDNHCDTMKFHKMN